jgi:non-homologous end joining protein Ku
MKLTKSTLKQLIREELDNMISEEAVDNLEQFKELLAAKAKFETIRSGGNPLEQAKLKAKIVNLGNELKDSIKKTSNPEAEITSIVNYIFSLPVAEQEDAIVTGMTAIGARSK